MEPILDERSVLRNKRRFVFRALLKAIFDPPATEDRKDFDRALAWAKSGQVGLFLNLFARLVELVFDLDHARS